MKTRGRKSAAGIVAAGAVALVERPVAPLDMTPEQGDVWVSVTSALPADWFSPENLPLLAQYCRHVVNGRRLAQLIDMECAREELDIRAYTDLLSAEHKQSSVLKTLAASMRLAQQAKYNALSADTAKRSVGTVKRPWES